MTAKMKFNTGDKALLNFSGKLYECEILYPEYYGLRQTVRYKVRHKIFGRVDEGFFPTSRLLKPNHFAVGL